MTVVSDVSRVDKLIYQLEYLRDHQVEIGIFGDDEEGSHLVMIASVHEFGCRIEVTPRMRGFLHHIGIHLRPETTHIDIPERSYMRSTIDGKQSEIDNMVRNQVINVVAMRTTAHTALGRIGDYVTGLIQRRITQLDTPPNHPVTMERKGSTNPLISSGRLRQNVTWRVVSV